MNLFDGFGVCRNAFSLGSALKNKDAEAVGEFCAEKSSEIALVAVSAGVEKAAMSSIQKISTNYLDNILKNPIKIQGQSLSKVKLAVRLSSKWQGGTLTNGTHAGQGFKATNGADGLIQWHPGGFHHFNGSAYWKISSGIYGKKRFPY